MNLKLFGYIPFFEAYFNEYSDKGFYAGRVAAENKTNYLLYTELGELIAGLSGKMFYNIKNKAEFPAVGDWVVFQLLDGKKKAVIHAVLPRKTKFSRKVPGGKTDEQVIASNIDILFIMSSLNQDLNLRRLERYLTLAWEGEAIPVILLSKSDLCENIQEIQNEIENIAFGVPVHVISSITNKGLEEIGKYFNDNKTSAIVGSSGVGKTTLINTLLGYEKLKVNETMNYKDKGVHTTARRELILLPNGGLIMDTPGMRELQLWEGSEGIGSTFEDVESLISNCKFSDCKHESEPGCAVIEALENGTLDEDRYYSYLKLRKEANFFERKHNIKAMLEEKRKWKKKHMEGLLNMKFKGR